MPFSTVSAGSKYSQFSKKAVWIEVLVVRYLLRYINLSFNSLSIGDTKIYWGGSLVEKIIIIVPFDMQSAYFLYFRSRSPQFRPVQNNNDMHRQRALQPHLYRIPLIQLIIPSWSSPIFWNLIQFFNELWIQAALC